MIKSSSRLASGALVLLMLAGCGEQGSASGEDTTARFTAAADALSAKLEEAGKQGQVPPASDPAVKAFQAEAARGLQALGTPALPLDGFDSFDSLCAKTATIVGAYMNVGIEGAPAAEQAARMERNVEQNLDTMFTPLLFSARCMAAHMPFLQENAGDDTSSKAEALQQVRSGAYRQVGGLIQMAAASDMDEPRRRQVLDVLSENADEFAIVLSLAQRQELAGAAESIRSSFPADAHPKIDQVKTGLSSAPCNSLCKM